MVCIVNFICSHAWKKFQNWLNEVHLLYIGLYAVMFVAMVICLFSNDLSHIWTKSVCFWMSKNFLVKQCLTLCRFCKQINFILCSHLKWLNIKQQVLDKTLHVIFNNIKPFQMKLGVLKHSVNIGIFSCFQNLKKCTTDFQTHEKAVDKSLRKLCLNVILLILNSFLQSFQVQRAKKKNCKIHFNLQMVQN